MEDKNAKIRNYILELLESGGLNAGDKLPGARQLAETIGCSFPHVQLVIESLSQCGILETISRSGTYVREDWQERILPHNFAMYCGDRIPILYQIFQQICQQTGLRATRRFERGTFEVRITHALMSEHDSYLDLSEAFERCCKRNEFFSDLMAPFYIDGKLCGIPLVFSPRVIFYNPEIFACCGCPLPLPDWTWDDFMETVRCLRRVLPGNRVYAWSALLQDVINTIIRSGGNLFHCNGNWHVGVGSPQTIAALERHVELREALGYTGDYDVGFWDDFLAGKAAMWQGARQSLYRLNVKNLKFELRAAPLPKFPGGNDVNVFGADLLCVHKSCQNRELIDDFISAALSEKTQDFLGKNMYGIPFRRSSAFKTLDTGHDYDALLMEEIPKSSIEYYTFSPDIYRIVFDGIARICLLPPQQVAKEATELSNALNTIYKINQFSKHYYRKD